MKLTGGDPMRFGNRCPVPAVRLSAWLGKACLQFLPGVPTASPSVKNPSQELPTDVGLMRVGYAYGDVALDHELMLPARVRTFKSQLRELSDDIFSLDWSKGRHQATSLTISSIPSIVGI